MSEKQWDKRHEADKLKMLEVVLQLRQEVGKIASERDEARAEVERLKRKDTIQAKQWAEALGQARQERDAALAEAARLKHEVECREEEQERLAGILHQEAQRRAAAEAEVEQMKALLQQLLLGIDAGFEDGECLPEDLHDAYEAARAALGYPLVIAIVDGLEGRYQYLKDALAGEPWPPPADEWVESKPQGEKVERVDAGDQELAGTDPAWRDLRLAAEHYASVLQSFRASLTVAAFNTLEAEEERLKMAARALAAAETPAS